jgi:hypothetical protein
MTLQRMAELYDQLGDRASAAAARAALATQSGQRRQP